MDLDRESGKDSFKKEFKLNLGGYLKKLVTLGQRRIFKVKQTLNTWEKAGEKHRVLLEQSSMRRSERREEKGMGEQGCFRNHRDPGRSGQTVPCVTVTVHCPNKALFRMQGAWIVVTLGQNVTPGLSCANWDGWEPCIKPLLCCFPSPLRNLQHIFSFSGHH